MALILLMPNLLGAIDLPVDGYGSTSKGNRRYHHLRNSQYEVDYYPIQRLVSTENLPFSPHRKQEKGLTFLFTHP